MSGKTACILRVLVEINHLQKIICEVFRTFLMRRCHYATAAVKVVPDADFFVSSFFSRGCPSHGFGTARCFPRGFTPVASIHHS